MKKNFLALTIAILVTASALFAQENKTVPAYIVSELHKEFTDASGVQWKNVDMFYKATFVSDGAELQAFYTADGELTAVSRKIKVEQLPLVLIKEVKQKSMNYGISELFELLTDNGTEYFLVINDEKETKRFRSEGNSWTRY